MASNSAAVRGVLACCVRTVAVVASRAMAAKAPTQTLGVAGLRVIRSSTLASSTGRVRISTAPDRVDRPRVQHRASFHLQNTFAESFHLVIFSGVPERWQ